MDTRRNAARSKATPQVAAVVMGSIALGTSWAASGSGWQAGVVAVCAAGGAYAGQRWSLARGRRSDQENVPPHDKS